MKKKHKKGVFYCSECGSENVHALAWVNPNTKKIIDYQSPDEEDGWCEECKTHVALLFQE